MVEAGRVFSVHFEPIGMIRLSVEDDFFGARMFWSSFTLEGYLGMLREVGFEVLDVGVAGGGWGNWLEAEEERHPLVLARRVSELGFCGIGWVFWIW